MRNVRFESKTTPSHWKSLRVLGVLFCLIVLTVGFAGAAGASGIDITLGTPASGDNWAYDSLNETLTLNGGTWEYINATGAGDLIIELNGTNNITGGFVVLIIEEGVEYQDFYSIYVMDGNLTIQNGADGSLLNVTADASKQYAAGIYAEGNIIFESGTVEIDICGDGNVWGVCADGAVSISGGQVNIEAASSGDGAKANGIYAYEIEILGGAVNIEAEASGDEAKANGIYAYEINILGGAVTVESHSVDGSAYGIHTHDNLLISGSAKVNIAEVISCCSSGIDVWGNLTISNTAEVNVTAVNSSDNYTFGIYTYDNLLISDSAKVNVADVTSAGESSYGIYVDDGNLVISDSAKVNIAEVISCCSSGIEIFFGDLTISNTAEVKVTAVYSTDDSAYGIYTYDNLLISDSAKINVADVTADSDSKIPSRVSAYGILTSSGNLTISDSAEVTVTEVTGLSASGIGTGWDIEISGGTVTVDVQATAVECPVQGIIPYYDAVISGGAVTVNAISLNGPAYGLSSYMDDILISGGEVTVNAKAGGESESVISAYSIQSQRGVIEISGGVVTANAKATEEADAYGLSAESEITISDGSVTVYADAAGDYAYGIYVDSGGVFAQTNGVVNTRAKVTGDLGYAYGVGDHKSEITGGKITAIGDNWAFAASYSSDRLIVASTLTVRASENIEGTGLSEVSPSVVTEVGSEYKYVVIEYLQKDDTPSGNSGSSSKPSKPSKPVEPEIPEEPLEPGIITPSETIVEDTKEIIVSDETTEVLETGETVTVVELEDTEIIQSVAVPEEIAEENPGASVMVTEGNKDTVLLPGDITTEDVHVIVDLAVVDTEGKPVKIKSSGYFILDANVPNGKKLAVGHYKDGIWEDCKVEHIGNGQYKVHYNSLSPFAAVFIEEDEESPFVVAEEPVDEPEIPENPESSMPILAVLAGLGVVVLIRRK